MSRQQLLAQYLDNSSDDAIPVVSIESADIARAMDDATSLAQGLVTARNLRKADEATGQIQFGLESLHQALTKFNADGGLTASEFNLVNIGLESHCRHLEVENIGLGVSLESFTEEAPKQVVSLEELEKLIEQVDGNHSALAADGHEHSYGMCEILKQAIPDAAARLHAFLAKVGELTLHADYADTQIDGEGVARALMNGDEFPADFKGYMERYVSFGKKIVGEFIEGAAKAAEAASAFDKIGFTSVEEFDAEANKIADSVADPRSKLGEDDYELCLPGCGPLFADNLDGVNDTDGKIEKLVVFATNHAPVDPNEFETAAVAPATIHRLSVEEIRSIGEALHGLAMECDTAKHQDEGCDAACNLDKAITAFTSNYDAAGEVADLLANDASVVLQYLSAVNTMVRWTPVFFLTNLVQTINAFLTYAERSFGEPALESQQTPTTPAPAPAPAPSPAPAPAPAPAEPPAEPKPEEGTKPVTTATTDGNHTPSNESVSLEAGFKLRPGMRVKYSGGYGKIIKIFDRPTKYKGEIHHCTKDNPKYEVKSDVGNKLSLHKGSALTPY